MKYLIRIYEEEYKGLHGIETTLACECDSEEEINEIVLQEGRDLINSYSFLMKELEEEAQENSNSDSEYWEILEELIDEKILCEIYPLETDLSINELDKMAYNDFDEVINLYQKEEY